MGDVMSYLFTVFVLKLVLRIPEVGINTADHFVANSMVIFEITSILSAIL